MTDGASCLICWTGAVSGSASEPLQVEPSTTTVCGLPAACAKVAISGGIGATIAVFPNSACSAVASSCDFAWAVS